LSGNLLILARQVGCSKPFCFRKTQEANGRGILVHLLLSTFQRFCTPSAHCFCRHYRVPASVANMTRSDARDFLKIAADIRLQPKVTVYSLDQANGALAAVKNDAIDGAAVIVP
jgi:D-arabinose 1-dehydrogenase-like Zn-dependent alcohol dehydrogenase